MRSLKRVLRSPVVQQACGRVLAGYLRLVWKTNRLVLDPPNLYDLVDAHVPLILAMWHGQHFMTPFVKPPHLEAKVLISRHRDGELNAIVAERLGIGTIRGSGDHDGRFDRKGGVAGFLGLLEALSRGCNVALTADVPKVARVVGPGIVLLGRLSGRPIVPVAMATSRRVVLDSWDKSAVNLPFGRISIAVGEPVLVPADADDAMMEEKRRTLEDTLNSVTQRAYDLVDGKGRQARG